MNTGDIIIIILGVAILIMQLVILTKKGDKQDMTAKLEGIRHETGALKAVMAQMQGSVNDVVDRRIKDMSERMQESQDSFRKAMDSSALTQEERFKTFSAETEQKLENIRGTLEHRLRGIQEDNSKRLEEMRITVNDKLQQSIDKKMTESFKQVSDRLEQVYKGLGEMQNVASGVGDLKKVLTNVKTRGILGEIQLGAILEDILSPSQYDVNCQVKNSSREAVEFAVKIPTKEGDYVYLPIDSKFPMDTYNKLLEAYDSGDKTEIDAASKALGARIKQEAKDISTKYIYPPQTTEFGIMFLPFEGLYSEVVNRGLLEEIQRTYSVTVAGPSTMAAMLCSIRMCFNNAAIQKRSSEVWKVLGTVKTEFANFEKVLSSTQKKLESAGTELEKLVGTRTRAINKSLEGVSLLEEENNNTGNDE